MNLSEQLAKILAHHLAMANKGHSNIKYIKGRL